MNCKIIIFIIFLFICVEVHAGYYVFHDAGKIIGKQGPCGRSCRLRPGALSVDKNIFDSTNKAIHKVVNGFVVDKIQVEIDADLQTKVNAQLQADRNRADKLEFTMQDVIKALIKIINIRIPNNPITKQEIIDQLKIDLGL